MLLRNDSSSHSPPFLWAQESVGLDEGDLRQAPTLQPVPVAVPLAHAGYSSLRGAGLSPHVITCLAVVVLPACGPPDNCAPSRAIRPEGASSKGPSSFWSLAACQRPREGSRELRDCSFWPPFGRRADLGTFGDVLDPGDNFRDSPCCWPSKGQSLGLLLEGVQFQS